MKNKLPPLTFSCYMMSHEDLTTQYSMDVLIEKDIKVASCVFTITEPYPEPTITYIQTFERYQRQGVATAIVQELQRKYGGIVWDYKFTDAGRRWFNTLIDRKIVKNSCYV